MELITTITTTVITAAAGAGAGTGASGGFWTVTAAQLLPLVAAIIAAAGVAATLWVNAARERRQNLTTLYGDALGAVSEYLEGPYRVLRKDGDPATRFTITSGLSDVKTSIDHHQALLRLHAHPVVADAYDHYVTIAKTEAGKQMHDAWKAPAVTTDAGVNLDNPLPREASDRARIVVLEAMQAHLLRRSYHAETRERFKKAQRDVEEARRTHATDRQAAANRQAQANAAPDAQGQTQP